VVKSTMMKIGVMKQFLKDVIMVIEEKEEWLGVCMTLDQEMRISARDLFACM